MTGARLCILTILLVLLTAGIISAARIGLSDLEFTRTQMELNFWERQGYTPDNSRISNAGRNVDRALERWPGNPDYLAAKAQLLQWQAYWHSDPDYSGALNEQAINLRIQALESRPAYREAWIDLAILLAKTGNHSARLSWATEKIAQRTTR
jgi:hypothetical protein